MAAAPKGRQHPADHEAHEHLQRERWELLRHFDELTEASLIVLSLIWLGLLILDFTSGLGPFLQTVSTIIWGIFILDFGIEILIAPRKLAYLRRHWLTAVSLMLPALRVFRLARALRLLRATRATRSLGRLRLVTSLNRGMRALGNVLGRRGIGYIIALTVIITFAGAAGMYFFEQPSETEGQGLPTYGEAVWWTAMIMTTMGSEYWPETAEGRILGWLLSLYAFAIFGYITATIASYFIGQDKTSAEAAPTPADTSALQQEIASLQAQLQSLSAQLEASTRERQPPPE